MAAAEPPTYPWYGVVSGRDLEQGDILFNCPVFAIPPEAANGPGQHPVRVDRQHVIVMTQSCDLAIRSDGTCNASEVILASLYFKHELTNSKLFGNKHGWNDAKKGKFPAYHVLNECTVTLPLGPLSPTVATIAVYPGVSGFSPPSALTGLSGRSVTSDTADRVHLV